MKDESIDNIQGSIPEFDNLESKVKKAYLTWKEVTTENKLRELIRTIRKCGVEEQIHIISILKLKNEVIKYTNVRMRNQGPIVVEKKAEYLILASELRSTYQSWIEMKRKTESLFNALLREINQYSPEDTLNIVKILQLPENLYKGQLREPFDIYDNSNYNFSTQIETFTDPADLIRGDEDF